MLKIVFYGKSGSGKSTVATAACEYFKKNNKTIEIIKLAAPLYHLQNEVYKTAGVEIGYYDQNQKILEDMAKYLREINPNSLVENFAKVYNCSKAEVIINDDLRDVEVDYPYLKNENFKFIKIECDEEIRRERLKLRKDLCSVLDSDTTKYVDQIVPDYVINTSAGDKNVTIKEITDILGKMDEA